MPVPSSIADLSTTPSLNSPAGSESPSSIDDYLRTHAAFIKQINDLAETKADDSAVVKLTGAQAVAGTKTFSASPVVPDATAPKHPVTKDQLDAKAPIASPAFTGVPTAPNPATGTRSTAIATMQKFAEEFVVSLAASGYQKLPSGLIIQWGYVLVPASSTLTVAFPISFPNDCLVVFASKYDSIVNGSSYRWDCGDPSKYNFRVANNFASAAIGGAWFAIGY